MACQEEQPQRTLCCRGQEAQKQGHPILATPLLNRVPPLCIVHMHTVPRRMGQYKKLANRAARGNLDVVWDLEQSSSRLGAIKSRRKARDEAAAAAAAADGGEAPPPQVGADCMLSVRALVCIGVVGQLWLTGKAQEQPCGSLLDPHSPRLSSYVRHRAWALTLLRSPCPQSWSQTSCTPSTCKSMLAWAAST